MFRLPTCLRTVENLSECSLIKLEEKLWKIQSKDVNYPLEPNSIMQALQERKKNFKRMDFEVGFMASQEVSRARESICHHVKFYMIHITS